MLCILSIQVAFSSVCPISVLAAPQQSQKIPSLNSWSMHLVDFQDRRGKFRHVQCMERAEGLLRVQELAAQQYIGGSQLAWLEVCDLPLHTTTTHL